MTKFNVGDEIKMQSGEIATIISSINNGDQYFLKFPSSGTYAYFSYRELELIVSYSKKSKKMDINVGDKITVEMTVVKLLDDAFLCSVNDSTSNAYYFFNKDQILSHTPKKEEIKVGDKVKHKKIYGKYTVLGIDGKFAWCKFTYNNHYTFNIEYLTKCE